MESSFEQRKRELESECRMAVGLFDTVRERLAVFMAPFVARLGRVEQKTSAELVVTGLVSDLETKNAESIAYFFELDRKRMQQFIGASPWDDLPLRDELARQVTAELGEPDGVIVFDPSAFPKSGKLSVGVARQWCGRLGKVDNCQVGIFMAYVSGRGHALIDSALYLPKEWTSDKRRMEKAGVPKDRQKYRTRHQLILEQLDRYGDQLPHAWISGDDELGRPAEFRRKLRARKEQYLLAVPCNTLIRDMEVPPPEHQGQGKRPKPPFCRVDRWNTQQPESTWEQVDVRDTEQGPLIVEALKRRVQTGRGRNTADETLVIVRYRDRDCAVVKTDYYLGYARQEVSLREFCRVAKAQHRVEECIQRAKGQAGLADYEVRNWVGWHHHQTLSLLATWFLLAETRQAEKKDTGDHLQPGASGYCVRAAACSRARFTQRRKMAHRDTIAANPNG
jgi:SRSO17 transposase